ncbi:unnamed protein product, partial [Ectocarpus sp. 8 AP-2014]
MNDLKNNRFFITRCMSLWYICLAEALARVDGRTYRDLFKTKSAKRRERWDSKRKISYVFEGDVLCKLISVPVLAKMKKLEMLRVVRVVDSVDCQKELSYELGPERTVGACAVLQSLAQPDAVGLEGLQGMHSEMSAGHEWKENFGFSTITAATEPIYIDINPGYFDGKMGKVFGKVGTTVPVRVIVPAAHTLVFNGVARH